MMPLLSIQNLCKDFLAGGLWAGRIIHALDHVSLDVEAGESLGLVGESGCGKTTLARCALRLLEPTTGTVSFDGADLARLSPHMLRRKRREFQIVFQDPLAALDPNLTVREILMEPFEIHALGTRPERKAWIEELAQAVSLDCSVLCRRPVSLSGGQQQRVGIARALALKPRLLLADEPVSALDASVQAQILNILGDLKQRFSLTLVLISHSLSVVHYLCSRVAVMYWGRIVEDAPSATFFSGPMHPYSQLLLQSMPAPEATAPQPQLGGRDEDPKVPGPPAGCPFHPRCPHARPRCRTEIPELKPCGSNAKVACFLYT